MQPWLQLKRQDSFFLDTSKLCTVRHDVLHDRKKLTPVVAPHAQHYEDASCGALSTVLNPLDLPARNTVTNS